MGMEALDGEVSQLHVVHSVFPAGSEARRGYGAGVAKDGVPRLQRAYAGALGGIVPTALGHCTGAFSSMSKYHNKKTEYDGVMYDSMREAKHAKMLDLLKHATDRKERVLRVERQVSYPFVINGLKIATYRADFVVYYGDGRVQIEEVKGVETDVFKLKAKLMKALYPDTTLVIIR